MNLSNWKIYDKEGSPLNWTQDSYLNLYFEKDSSSSSAEGYLVTDPSGNVIDAVITNSGFYYTDPTSVYYQYTLDNPIQNVDITADVSVLYKDVSVFNPNPINTQGIGGLADIDISANFLYPSTTYSAAIYLDPVSQGLVETEHLYFFEQFDSSLVRPYDTSTSTLVFQMVGDESEISMFVVDDTTQTITWTDFLQYELDEWADGTPIQINVGFRAEDEGVYERRLRIYNVIDDSYYIMGEVLVTAESIGEDERFRTLLSNFGLPDAKDIPKIFNEADINEDLPDFQIVNPKSKLMILNHDQIIPYIGTYKALINAIKWLGYDDVYFREWFKNVKENKKLSFIVPYDAKDRTQTILMFSPDQRKALKKLNQLSLNYCINRETGEVDEWGTPETENCYEFNIKEVFIKLLSLKKWLEKNILGVNARIIDLTGEGVYFERFINLIYTTENHGYEYNDDQHITPYTDPDNSELVGGEASINMTLLEFTNLRIEDFDQYRFSDFIDYIWNPLDPSVTLDILDPSYLADPSAYLEMGPPLSHPFVSLREFQWSALSKIKYSAVIPETLVTNPLWIYNNEIRFYNWWDTSTVFYDTSTNVDIIIKEAYLRDASDNDWANSVAYSIYPNTLIELDASIDKIYTRDASYAIIEGSGILYQNDVSTTYNVNLNITDPSYFYVTWDSSVRIVTDTSTDIQSRVVPGYTMESSTGIKWKFDNYIFLSPQDTSARLQYALDETYRVPLLSMEYWKTQDSSGDIINFDKMYHLDILDGQIVMDASLSPDVITTIDFSYDKLLEEQSINLGIEYISPRVPIYVIDPSIYYWADPSHLSGGNDPSIYAIDNSIYTLVVNHIGEYNVEVHAWDGYNIMFYNLDRELHDVWVKTPTIYTLIDNSVNVFKTNESSTYMLASDVNDLIAQNTRAIYDRKVPYIGLSLQFDVDGKPYINAPEITYFQDVPEDNSFAKFYNVTEDVTNIAGNVVTVDPAFQTFNTGDSVNLMYTYKGDYMLVEEASSYITLATGNDLTLDQIPPSFILDGSHALYITNDTSRGCSNLISNGMTDLIVDISGYVFEENQVVNIIAWDLSTGNDWGATYRVVSVDGSTHTMDKPFPAFLIDNSTRYDITAQHAFSSFTNYIMDVSTASEISNNFHINVGTDYRQYFIDNTFVMFNILFNHEYVNDQWYDSSVNETYYSYTKPITIDVSTLVIIKSEFDSSTYMLNELDIITVRENLTKDLVFRVFNNAVPFVFDTSGYYDVAAGKYDSYGNLSIKLYEGLIHVV